MLTEALVAVRQGAPPPAASSGLLMATCTPSTSSSSSQPSSGTPPAQSAPTQETPVCAKPGETVRSATPSGTKTTIRSRYLSDRGNGIRQQQGLLQEGFLQYALDKYHETDNPDVSLHESTSG